MNEPISLTLNADDFRAYSQILQTYIADHPATLLLDNPKMIYNYALNLYNYFDQVTHNAYTAGRYLHEFYIGLRHQARAIGISFAQYHANSLAPEQLRQLLHQALNHYWKNQKGQALEPTAQRNNDYYSDLVNRIYHDMYRNINLTDLTSTPEPSEAPNPLEDLEEGPVF